MVVGATSSMPSYEGWNYNTNMKLADNFSGYTLVHWKADMHPITSFSFGFQLSHVIGAGRLQRDNIE